MGRGSCNLDPRSARQCGADARSACVEILCTRVDTHGSCTGGSSTRVSMGRWSCNAVRWVWARVRRSMSMGRAGACLRGLYMYRSCNAIRHSVGLVDCWWDARVVHAGRGARTRVDDAACASLCAGRRVQARGLCIPVSELECAGNQVGWLRPGGAVKLS